MEVKGSSGEVYDLHKRTDGTLTRLALDEALIDRIIEGTATPEEITRFQQRILADVAHGDY